MSSSPEETRSFLENERLEEILSRLRTIPHIELLRIGTRAPVTLPQRITGGSGEDVEKISSSHDLDPFYPSQGDHRSGEEGL